MKELTDNQIYILCHVATCNTFGFFEDGLWKYPGLYRPSVEKLISGGFLACEEYDGTGRQLFITEKGCDAVASAVKNWHQTLAKRPNIGSQK